MTTMFIQLRRVVYLLVLLHFCTCVAYAQSDSSVSGHDFKQKVEEFELMWNVLKGLMIDAEDSSLALGDEINECDVYSTLALRAKEQLDTLTEGANAEMNPINTFTNQEQRKKFETALQKANDVLSNAPLAVNKTRKAAKEFNETLTEREKLANDIISQATEFMRSHETLPHSLLQTYLEVENKFEAGRKDGKAVLSFVTVEKWNVGRAFDAAEEAEKNVESLGLAVQAFNEYLKEHGINPEEETTDSQQNTSENESSPGGVDTTIEGNKNESTVETPEENENSQSNTPKPSDSSASGSSPSQEEETTNSPSSSAPNHLDNTQSSDSSSSPALVHSPLLLLLVSMCVLGCTAVF